MFRFHLFSWLAPPWLNSSEFIVGSIVSCCFLENCYGILPLCCLWCVKVLILWLFVLHGRRLGSVWALVVRLFWSIHCSWKLFSGCSYSLDTYSGLAVLTFLELSLINIRCVSRLCWGCYTLLLSNESRAFDFIVWFEKLIEDTVFCKKLIV